MATKKTTKKEIITPEAELEENRTIKAKFKKDYIGSYGIYKAGNIYILTPEVATKLSADFVEV